MIQVKWHYKGDTDRVLDRLLVLLPPLPSSTSTSSWLKGQSSICENYRKTLKNLCANEQLKYIFVYVPNFDPTCYEQRCLFEDFYGTELRLIPTLEKLLDRTFPDYLTFECIYMLEKPEDWMHSKTPLEWYFDAFICDQLYEYYDTTSKWLRKELPKFIDGTIGASQIYEIFLTKKVLLQHTAVNDTDTDTDNDVVFIFGDIEPFEKEAYLQILKRLIDDSRVSAIFSYGNFTPALQTLRHQLTPSTSSSSKLLAVPKFELYLHSDLSPTVYAQLLVSLLKYSPTYTYFLWLGVFQLDNHIDDGYKHSSRKPYTKAFIYSPPAWCSLHPNTIYTEETGSHLTFEPCGMLNLFADGDT